MSESACTILRHMQVLMTAEYGPYLEDKAFDRLVVRRCDRQHELVHVPVRQPLPQQLSPQNRAYVPDHREEMLSGCTGLPVTCDTDMRLFAARPMIDHTATGTIERMVATVKKSSLV